jgi:hypothetical protein
MADARQAQVKVPPLEEYEEMCAKGKLVCVDFTCAWRIANS